MNHSFFPRTVAVALAPLLTLLLLGACSSFKSSTQSSQPVAKRAVERSAVPPSQRLRAEDVRRVRSGEFVKTYHLGRRVEGGSSGRTMHEAHRVYRLERPSRWNLAREQPPLASTGPVNRVVDPAFSPTPTSKEIAAELNRQQAITGELQEARAELLDTIEAAKARLAGAADNNRVIVKMQQRVGVLERENAELKRTQSALSESSVSLSESSNAPKPSDALRQWGESLDHEDEGSHPGELP